MSVSYISHNFNSGSYRAKLRVHYKDANNQTYTKKSPAYSFVATGSSQTTSSQTTTTQPTSLNFVSAEMTHSHEYNYATFEVRWDYGYLLNSTYNRRLYTSISQEEFEANIASCSFAESNTNYMTVTFEPATVRRSTYSTTNWTRNGSPRAATISSRETIETVESRTSVIRLDQYYTTLSAEVPTDYQSSATYSRNTNSTHEDGNDIYRVFNSTEGINMLTNTSASYNCNTLYDFDTISLYKEMIK